MGSNSTSNGATPVNGSAERRVSSSTESFTDRHRGILPRRGWCSLIRVGAGGLGLPLWRRAL